MAFRIHNLAKNNNIKVLNQLEDRFYVLEHQLDLSTEPKHAETAYFMHMMDIKKRQLLVKLNNRKLTVQSGAMQWTVGNVESAAGFMGAADIAKKVITSKASKESIVKPVYSGTGNIMLEPTYKHILLIDVAQWGSIVLQDGLFLACDATLQQKLVPVGSVSAVVAGGESIFNFSLRGEGIVALESDVAQNELIEFELDNDVLKVDGNMAIAWSDSLKFTVERSSKTLLGSALNDEGLVNVFRGTGRVLVAPVEKRVAPENRLEVPKEGQPANNMPKR